MTVSILTAATVEAEGRGTQITISACPAATPVPGDPGPAAVAWDQDSTGTQLAPQEPVGPRGFWRDRSGCWGAVVKKEAQTQRAAGGRTETVCGTGAIPPRATPTLVGSEGKCE